MIDTFESSIIEWNGLGWASASFDELFAIERYDLFTTHTFPNYRSTVSIYNSTKWVRSTLILGPNMSKELNAQIVTMKEISILIVPVVIMIMVVAMMW